jgi:hypothetical protein
MSPTAVIDATETAVRVHAGLAPGGQQLDVGGATRRTQRTIDRAVTRWVFFPAMAL